MTSFRLMLLTTSALCGLSAVPSADAQTADATQTAAVAQTNDPATATNPAPGQADTNEGEILVTARRRNESIVDVPLAITVVGSEQLEKLAITSTAELANFVPGLQFSDFTPGNSRNDRGGNRPLIFRGLNLSNNGGVTGAGSMFLDGAAVIGNEIPAGMDIGAVEVLRGPQNVYFGRASMTGAVSYRTKAIPDRWQLGIDMTAAERSTYRAEASIAGPVIPGLIGVRLTALAEGNAGYVTNGFDPGGEKLGARSRKSVSATLDITPAKALEVKLYANYFRDDDGPSATAAIYSQNANCTLPGATRTTFCGKVPDPDNAVYYINTIVPQQFSDVIYDTPVTRSAGFEDKLGLQREVLNAHAVVNLQLSEYLKAQSITGYHQNIVLQATDGIGQQPTGYAQYAQYFYSLTNNFKDFSQELRLSSDPDRAFSWTIGGNFVDATNHSNAIVAYLNQTRGAPGVGGIPTTFTAFPQNLGTDKAKTYGAFAGAYLKLFGDKLTVSAEGRYQIDKRETITDSFAGVRLSDVKADFKSFNPRVSLDYDVGGGRKIYTSYATGTRPGGFNAGLLVYYDPTNPIYTRTSPAPLNYDAVTADITSVFGVTDPTYKEEKLKIGELGFKGNFAGGAGYFDINGYYGVLSNQQIRKSLLVPSLGFALGAVTNTGETEIYGVEWAGNFNFTRDFSLATTFAWNHTNRTTFRDPSPGTIAQFGGTGDFDGTQLNNTPEFTGSAVLSYEGQLTADLRYFTNIAYVYRGKQFTDIANVSYIDARSQVDLRAGVSQDRITLEAFVTNVFDDQYWTGGNVAADFGGAANAAGSLTYYSFFGAIAPPRTVGMRLSYRY